MAIVTVSLEARCVNRASVLIVSLFSDGKLIDQIVVNASSREVSFGTLRDGVYTAQVEGLTPEGTPFGTVTDPFEIRGGGPGTSEPARSPDGDPVAPAVVRLRRIVPAAVKWMERHG